jgi:isopentenyl phosphate kinase
MKKKTMFIKLGGSLITDKNQRETPQLEIIKVIARVIQNFINTFPHTQLLIGHGSGSFGHWEATKHDTRNGVNSPPGWHGFARVSASANRLNRLVVDTFLDVGVNVVSLQPSASIESHSRVIKHYNTVNIQHCFTHGLVPLIHGDVSFDSSLGGTILSTEAIFSYLTPLFCPERIILLGEAEGVYNRKDEVIRKITPVTYPEIQHFIGGSNATDVTGGMSDKVNRMIDLVKSYPKLCVQIMSGKKPDLLSQVLQNNSYICGTLITGDSTTR